ncbi:MAG: glycosyltransferase family 2 protein [Solirubrobacteraceae bacterium]
MSDPVAAVELSVVLVNHNGGRFLPAALAALQANTACPEAEIIIVDSGSTDGSTDAEQLAAGPLPVRVISRTENIGFCAGSNLGAIAARGRLVCFTQTDGEVAPGWDVPLRAALDGDAGVAAAGGVVLKTSGLIDSAGIAIAPNFAAWGLRENQTPAQAGVDPGTPAREAVGVSPALLMARRADHLRIGGFWETLWMYGDEPDYALRIGRLGRVLVCPDSRMLHHIGGAAGEHQSPLRLYQSSRNRLLNIARHLPGRKLPGAIALAAAFDALQLAQQRNGAALRAIATGWIAGLRGMPDARTLSTPGDREASAAKLATLREALVQQRALGRASIAGGGST